MTPTPTQDVSLTSFRKFLLDILPEGVPVVLGQVNRVPEVKQGNFVIYWPIFRPRLATDVDTFFIVPFTGFISGSVLTVTVTNGYPLKPNSYISAMGIAAATLLVAPISIDYAGIGTYTVSKSQTLSSRAMSAGVRELMQETELDIQVDVHGPIAADNAQVISTMFRSEYATSFFAADGDVLSPLLADDPRQMAFYNGENQYEDRWIVQARMQINPVIRIPQQSAGAVSVGLINVDATYPIEES